MERAGITLGMGSFNERRRYNVTIFIIGWAHTQNDPWKSSKNIIVTRVLTDCDRDKMATAIQYKIS